MTHTPGPWRIDYQHDGKWFISAPLPHAGNAGLRVTPAHVFGEPDARLIAAAPDMLAALRELVELAEGFNDADHAEDGDEPIVAPILKRARAAIAKATQ